MLFSPLSSYNIKITEVFFSFPTHTIQNHLPNRPLVATAEVVVLHHWGHQHGERLASCESKQFDPGGRGEQPKMGGFCADIFLVLFFGHFLCLWFFLRAIWGLCFFFCFLGFWLLQGNSEFSGFLAADGFIGRWFCLFGSLLVGMLLYLFDVLREKYQILH